MLDGTPDAGRAARAASIALLLGAAAGLGRRARAGADPLAGVAAAGALALTLLQARHLFG